MAHPHQQKLKISGPVVITANRLADGVVIHRTSEGRWSENLAAAQILLTADEALAALKAAQADGLIAVGPYVARVEAAPTAKPGHSPKPGNLREKIRSHGPTFPLPSDAPVAYLPNEVGKVAA
ncbi:hypothetical protein Rvan_1350 [Rhodomicrobium vannielii ATCC 17100]|uniref:DUF2849 domain-containing protein n=1 Tax=Rhodomicrobium vannielii (strain ATCC 17100 / DSM 162 / LMG 4299 / NCIMB 10020 / ATH 3.1.1) TaxID=648757 RepID=E3I617_RHOVT|nr:DUF2849 domain-containing protein [Rhodomicrobium vannielii]ADP70610.1 hypothetical protein Rvan_1350 [Rhodomicrobium vannielii ATCC 17100]